MIPARFVRDYWRKKPLLVRQAIPRFPGILDREALFRLATRDDAISRLVIRHPRRWERHDGPFASLERRMLPARDCTLLVHGVESLVRGGWELLQKFSNIRHARVDDLMVSWAAPGGSVGPHDDRYDVFLLQGAGRRRWQIARGGDRALDEKAAIKVLKTFVPEEEWVLEPGDVLYLPPGVAHHGVALDECFTYSIGFLEPSRLELRQSFLGFLAGALDHDEAQVQPTVEAVAAALDGVNWDRALVEDFVGCFLTRPKPHVRFHPPARPLSDDEFARRLGKKGRLTLALPSRGLIRRGRVYFNGEAHAGSRALSELIANRELARPLALPPPVRALLRRWYSAGWLHL